VNKKVDGQKKTETGKESQRGKSLPKGYKCKGQVAKEKRKREDLPGE
jgi:hypothetical protein